MNLCRPFLLLLLVAIVIGCGNCSTIDKKMGSCTHSKYLSILNLDPYQNYSSLVDFTVEICLTKFDFDYSRLDTIKLCISGPSLIHCSNVEKTTLKYVIDISSSGPFDFTISLLDGSVLLEQHFIPIFVLEKEMNNVLFSPNVLFSRNYSLNASLSLYYLTSFINQQFLQILRSISSRSLYLDTVCSNIDRGKTFCNKHPKSCCNLASEICNGGGMFDISFVDLLVDCLPKVELTKRIIKSTRYALYFACPFDNESEALACQSLMDSFLNTLGLSLLLDLKWTSFRYLHQNSSIFIFVFDVFDLKNELFRPSASNPSMSTFQDITSRVKFSFVYGMNTALFSNVCLLNHTTLLLFSNQSNENSILSSELRSFLDQSFSGFYFKYHPWLYREINIARAEFSSQDQYDLGTNLSPEIWTPPWFRESGIMAVPAYGRSIFHAAQTLLSMVRIASWWLNEYHDDDVANSSTQKLDKEISELLLSSGHSLAFLFPQFYEKDYEWTLSLLSLVCQYFLSNSVHSDITPEIYLHEGLQAVFEAQKSRSGSSITCFRQLALVGTLELSLPFLPSVKQANHFRDYLYQSFHIPNDSITDSKSNSGSPSTTATKCQSPNHRLRVTWLLRPENRWILNIKSIMLMLKTTGLVDMEWLSDHIQSFDSLSFHNQVLLMSQTDILIAPHGAALTNLIFLQPHSAVIEIFTSPWYEIGYLPTALMFSIPYFILPYTQAKIQDVDRCSFPSFCLETPLLVQRRSLSCYGIRQCNAVIDSQALEVLVWQASQHVRILKRRMYSLNSLQRCEIYDSNDRNDRNHNHSESSLWLNCVYRKAYETSLINTSDRG